jgi:hypothetical protein
MRRWNAPQKLVHNPHFPALRSDPMALSGASRRKQSPSSTRRWSVDKYGDRGAWRLAMAQRQEWEKSM